MWNRTKLSWTAQYSLDKHTDVARIYYLFIGRAIGTDAPDICRGIPVAAYVYSVDDCCCCCSPWLFFICRAFVFHFVRLWLSLQLRNEAKKRFTAMHLHSTSRSMHEVIAHMKMINKWKTLTHRHTHTNTRAREPDITMSSFCRMVERTEDPRS